MADFAAILQKTLDRMGETTPETRAKVYDKARMTVRRQIESMDPTPPQSTVDRQLARLDEAIAATEARYAEVEADEDDFDDAQDGFADDGFGDDDRQGAADALFDAAPSAGPAPLYVDPPVAADLSGPPSLSVGGEGHGATEGEPELEDTGGGSRWLWPTVGVIALIVALGGGYYVYLDNQSGTVAATVTGEPADAGNVRTVEPADTVVDAGGNGEDVDKFTQRLTEDGREIDAGPAAGTITDDEGSSVADQTALLDPGQANGDQPGATGEATIPVGQRTIFYEERTGTQPGTAVQGATIWSVVEESPGAGLPLEPAIRAQASIPDLGMNMELTIRRNGDPTFPASHIVELFFTTPATFEGRGIADVQRITFKDTEQDTGSALIAVPAPLDTNIFLIALTDAQTAVDTNVALMRSQGWIDIPMQYVTGRRALITLEKGIAGDRVFAQVFDAWASAPLGTAQSGGG